MVKTSARFALRPKLISVAVASCFAAGTALANPTGHHVVRGTADIHRVGNLLQITNSPNAIINWQSFSIGANEITRFIQQSSSSAVLNRVTSQNPSSILGALHSNGRVFLINPNGILFGAGSTVDVAGLVASSLKLSNADFVAKRMRFADTPGAKPVINEGSIKTRSGGNVYLVGPDVVNSGIITTPKGEVVLAAGRSVELVNPSTPNLRVEIVADGNQATNLGNIVADAGRVGIYAGLINNAGTIRADSAVSEGGRILLKATQNVVLEDSSVLSAQGKGGGRIDVLADESVHVAGRLDASAPNGGNGGFIETSGKEFSIDPAASITTFAPLGKTGIWLIDPNDFLIGRDITGAQLGTNLGGTNVVITSDNGGTLGNGDVFVNEAVSWSSPFSLTLTAQRNVDVNQPITNGGTGGINLFAGWDGLSNPANPTLSQSGSVSLAAPITTGGDVKLAAGGFGSVGQNSSGVITADGLMADGLSVFLSSDFSGAVNQVNRLAGRSRFGDFHFTNGRSLTIGDVGGRSGIVSGPGCCDATVNIRVTNGNLTVNRNITAVAGNTDGVGSAEISLYTENGSIMVGNGAVISARGANAPGVNGSGGDAFVQLNTTVESGGSITVAGGSRIDAIGGNAATGSGSGGDATVTFISDGAITVDNSTIKATGGQGNGVEAEGGRANISFSASGGPIVVSNQSTLTALGGAGGSSGGGSANVSLFGNGVSISNSSITATGGAGSSNGGGFGSVSIQGNNAAVTMAGTSTIRASADGAEGGVINVNSNAGGIVLGRLVTDAEGEISVSASGSGGSITDGNAGVNLQTFEATLSASAGIGTIANPLETQVKEISLSSSTGEIGIINTGALLLNSLNTSGAAAIGATGMMTFGFNSFSVGGNLSLISNGMYVNRFVSAGGDLVMNAQAGNLDIIADGGEGQPISVNGNNVFLLGANVNVGGASAPYATIVSADNLLSVTTPGNVMVTGGNASGADAIMRGGVDVDMNMGGILQLTGNTTASSIAKVEAGSPSTIKLNFSGLSADGFSVNGKLNAIEDNGSGFFVMGETAILDENMFVTYGGPPPFTDVLVATMNQQVDVMADQLKAGDTGDGGEDKDKKKLPFCDGG